MKRYFGLILFFIFCSSVRAGGYQYTLSWDNPASHEYHVALVTDPAPGDWTEFRIPRWRPGRYILQDYAASVSRFEAMDSQGKPLKWEKSFRDAWRVKNPAGGAITVRYHWYANTMDAGSSVLDPSMAYFNPSNLFMYVTDRYSVPCTLSVPSMGSDWKAGTALHPGDQPKSFTATDYHEFVDAPTFLSPSLKTLEKVIGGTHYYFHFQGIFRGDAKTDQAFLDGVSKIIEAQTAVFGGAPMKEYHFLYLLTPNNIRHAVEHTYSSCYALPNTTGDSPQAIAGTFGITSHEFWHLWNVKRIRPAKLWPYDYKEEQYTSLHWFTEGVTEYYTSLMMVRAGLQTEERFLEEMSECFTDLEGSSATVQISPSQSSEDSWLYTSPYMHPHLRVSYYTHGQRLGFLLDLEIRKVTQGKKSLDDVFRYLFQTYYENNMGVPEEGIRVACEKVAGVSFETFFTKWVDGVEEIPYDAFVNPFGMEVAVEKEAGVDWAAIGVERADRAMSGIYISSVRPGSDAELAGIGDKDLIVEIEGKPATQFDFGTWVSKAKKGDQLNMMLILGNGVRSVQLTYTGKDWPKVYTLQRVKKPKPSQEEMYAGWLK